MIRVQNQNHIIMATDPISNDDLISPVPEKKLKIDPTAVDTSPPYQSILIKQMTPNNLSQTMDNKTQEEIMYNIENQEKECQNNMGFENQEKQLDAVMIEAVSGVSQGFDNDNDVVDDDEGLGGNDKELEGVDKRRKKARRRAKRRGKRRDWNGKSVENDKGGIVMVFKRGIGCEVKKDWTGLTYSREELEGLRFLNKEDQLKMWVQVYCGLGPVVSKEYDALVVNVNENEEHGVDFDPRKNFKDTAMGMLLSCYLSWLL